MDWSRVDAVADELSATRAEVLGLVLLVLGGVVVSWLVVRAGTPAVAPAGPTTVASPSTGASPSIAVSPFPADPAATSTPPAAGAGTLLVHVTGAVAAAGVVELAGGARVVDAVTAAGGPTADAATEALNMARPVADGERVHVPTPDEVAEGFQDAPATGPSAAPGSTAPGSTGQVGAVRDAEGRLDLNLATAADLEELPGVGPVLAERITAWREANGGFAAVGQLREVRGIGERTFQDLADLVVVG